MVKDQGVVCGIIRVSDPCPQLMMMIMMMMMMVIMMTEEEWEGKGGGEIENRNKPLKTLDWYLTSSQQDQTVYRQVPSNSHGSNNYNLK